MPAANAAAAPHRGACGCTNQVSLLDPVTYPGAIKAFAKEVCRNDLLNFGRLHFFFPDSRLALDLNTDKTLKAGSGAPLFNQRQPTPSITQSHSLTDVTR